MDSVVLSVQQGANAFGGQTEVETTSTTAPASSPPSAGAISAV